MRNKIRDSTTSCAEKCWHHRIQFVPCFALSTRDVICEGDASIILLGRKEGHSCNCIKNYYKNIYKTISSFAQVLERMCEEAKEFCIKLHPFGIGYTAEDARQKHPSCNPYILTRQVFAIENEINASWRPVFHFNIRKVDVALICTATEEEKYKSAQNIL